MTFTIFSQIKLLCHFLKQEVEQRFPQLLNGALASFVFLRFICPAIIRPHHFGITERKNLETYSNPVQLNILLHF
jgi:hypothetical protein